MVSPQTKKNETSPMATLLSLIRVALWIFHAKSGPALPTGAPTLKYSVMGLTESDDTRPCLISSSISITLAHLPAGVANYCIGVSACWPLSAYKTWKLDDILKTRSSAITERPRDASCQLKSCQLPRNSAETTYTTSPGRIDGMKLEI